MEQIDKIIELRKQTSNIQNDLWLNESLFSFPWWVSIILAIASVILFWKLVDKNRFSEITLVGFVSAVVTTLFNDIGVDLTLWTYPTQIFGLIRSFIILDLVMIPTAFMLLYQYFKNWKKYIIAITVFSAFGSFIAQPLFSLIGKYKLINWSYLYSFPVYIVMGILIKAVVSKIFSIEVNNGK